MSTLHVDIITLFPEIIYGFLRFGIVKRAITIGALVLKTWNPREHTCADCQTVDDRPYGGGPGMVLKVQPLRATLKQVKNITKLRSKIIYLSPQGQLLNQEIIRKLVSEEQLILIAGRYEGIDERLIEYDIDEELSIGDYIISGGELAALVLVEALVRLLPGVLHNADSARQDSFTGNLLDYPQYTRPAKIDGQQVPSVLLSGDHKAIACWRQREILGKTWLKRPALLTRNFLSFRDRHLLHQFIMDYLSKLGNNNKE